MSDVSNPGIVSDQPRQAASHQAPPSQSEAAGLASVAENPAAELIDPRLSKWYLLRSNGTALIKYLLDSEVHTYAFSVAANAILSFVPFVILLYALSHDVFHSVTMSGVVYDLVNNYFPSTSTGFKSQLMHSAPHHLQAMSVVLILISCTGIFLPLEVALNQAWGIEKSRNYLMNQLVAFGLALWMVVLGVASMALGAAEKGVLAFLMFHKIDNWFYNGVSALWLAVCSGVACILFLFSIYWLLPNCKVPWKPVLRTSIITGLIWLVAKYIFAAVLPHLSLSDMYGPFFVSVGLLFWAYISGLILFAGAQFSVSRLGANGK